VLRSLSVDSTSAGSLFRFLVRAEITKDVNTRLGLAVFGPVDWPCL
jgi:hypothetical protein